MKKFAFLTLCTASLLAFSACGGSTTEGEAPAESTSPTESTAPEAEGETAELSEVTFVLDWTPNTNHTGVYVADAMGYFEEVGLKVNIVQPPESGTTALIGAGKAEFGVSAQDTLVAALTSENPIDVVAVATLLQHNTSGIISRQGEGMDSPLGLEGKTYSTWDVPVELATIEYCMEQEGGDFSQVTLIPNVITDEPAALEAMQTDAIWVFYGWGGVLAETREFPFDFFYFKDYSEALDFYTPVIISNNAYLEENPEEAKAFLEACAKGYEYAIENPEAAAQILVDGDTTGALNDSIDFVTASQVWIGNEYKSEVEQWGYIDPTRWDGFFAWLFEEGLIENEIPAGTGFTNDYLS